MARPLRRDGFGYLKSRIAKLREMAQTVMPVLVVTDLDRAQCAPGLIASWLPRGVGPRLLFRVAVRETESWLLADREAFGELLGVSPAALPDRPDDLNDPKATLLKLVRKSKHRELREEILPKPGVSYPVGLGYNDRLSRFVRERWNSGRAARSSPSLARAVACIAQFETGSG